MNDENKKIPLYDEFGNIIAEDFHNPEDAGEENQYEGKEDF